MKIHKWFPHWFASQAAHPKGFFGRRMGRMMADLNRDENDWTLSLLDIQPSDTVLEVGFGPGEALRTAASMVSQGHIVGVEISRTMISMARRLNESAIREGRVEILHGDVSSQRFADDTFDKIYAINVLYFLSDVDSTLWELHRVMKPGGRIAFAFGDKKELVKEKFAQTGVFALYTGEEIVELLLHAGFVQAQYQTLNTKAGLAVCAVAEKTGGHEAASPGSDGS
jgi:ubiquinone/menaquinone biosynthesis C-methylase UbiE